MYLENLEIHGFKSFGKKTKFIFTDGITAIVGPNGCGKSNIVDAIRWVLGEQKAGFLRSDRMENVIFNGSRTLRPIGMAEVSLTIQNTKNILPIGYSEIVITRRLFRSLESQYLLNNSPCRLKDIQDLFMDTGMGPDAYSIIELSMVESILSGKTEERRRILEEAAGVMKYKMRRKSAFLKLEATETDLLRLNDIISEVEKNVSSLKRQVRKAQRHQEIKEELKEKEIRLATYQFSRIHFELEPLQEKFKETQNKREALTAQFDAKEAKIEASRVKLLEIERNLNAEQKELNELSFKIQKKEEEILVGRERRKALTDTKERLFREQEELNIRIEKTRTQHNQTNEKLQQLFQIIQTAEVDFQEKNVALKSVENRLQEKKAEFKGLEDKRVELLDGLSERKKEEERINTKLEHINVRLNALSRELEENEFLEKIRRDKLANLMEKKANCEAEVIHLEEKHKDIYSEINTLSKDKDTLKEKLLNGRSEVQTLRGRIELLKKFIETYEDHPEGVQHLLLSEFLNGGGKGTLAEILTVDSKYRLAIETALGEAAVSLIVKDTEQALQCIDVLKADGKGSVTFLPLERFSNGSNKNELDKQIITTGEPGGIIDWAYDLVQCISDYHPLVKSLLGEYLVVSDLEFAKKHADRLKKHRLNLVTLNGEIVSTWGPIKGGADGNSQAGVIGRKTLIEELQVRLTSLEEKLEKTEQEQSEKENNYKVTFEREQELNVRIKQQEKAVTELQVKLAQLIFESEKEAETRERISHERNSLVESQNALKSKLQKLSPSLVDLDKNKIKFDADHLKLDQELIELEQKVAEQCAVTHDRRVKLVGMKSEEKHLQGEISRIQEYERELAETFTRIDKDNKTATTEYETLEKRIEEIKEGLHEDFNVRQTLENKVHQIEQEFLDSKQKLEVEEKAIKEIRIERDRISETLHEIELRISELKMEGDTIRDKVLDEYNYEVKKNTLHENFQPEALMEEVSRGKNRLRAMEPVNLLALKEYEKEKSRLDFLTTQREDLVSAEENLNQTIRVINKTARERFLKIFEEIRKNFINIIAGFFENGKADLKLEPNVDPLEADIIIEADPKGRRLAALTLLSGGEKALTAISLLFAIYLVKPSPFCILDEVDAPLDDANIERFTNAIRKFSGETQFIIITHNKLTMRSADYLYGVTMQEEGISKVVSVNFTDFPAEPIASPILTES